MSTPRKKTRTVPRGFKLSAEADKALQDIRIRFGWTLTGSVERSILFSAASPDFGKPEAVR